MPRPKNLLVMAMMLLPLVIIAAVKYGPSFMPRPRIGSVSILPPHIYAPKQYDYMIEDVPSRLRQSLSTARNLRVQRTPLPSEVGQADRDLPELARLIGGADVLVLTTVTLDDGILELTLEVVDPATKKVLFNDAFESPPDRYAEMVTSAGTALKHVLER